MKRRGKYNNRLCTRDGKKFHSVAELARYLELKLLERAGEITDLICQPNYPLYVMGIQVGNYRGDFEYFDIDKEERVTEDVKGVETTLYKWKSKHFEAQFGKPIRIIRA